jgi:hypothetical protein
MAKTWLKVIKASVVGLWIIYHWSLGMSASLTAWSCQVSLIEHSRSSFDLTVMCRLLLSSLPTMPLTVISEKSGLWVVELITGVELSNNIFTFRTKWILLWYRVVHFHWNITLLQIFYLLKHLLLRYHVISKFYCNNLVSTLIMYLYVSYVCLYVLTSLRIS